MNLNSENTFLISTESSNEDAAEKVFTILQPLSDFYTNSARKRKWDEVTNSTVFSDSCSAEERPDVKISTDSCNIGKTQATVQFPDSAKRIRTLDRKEINVLRIQIAMISDVDGDRPIHVAVAQENLKLVQKLCILMLKSAISLDLTNYLRQTPLHLAVMLGNTDMVNLLLKCGASIVLRDRNGNSVIHLAVKTTDKKEIFDLILSHPKSKTILDSLDYDGYSALHYAVQRNSETAVRCLHGAGAKLNTIDGKSGRSPLIHAVMDHNVTMLNLLLEIGASAEVTDYSGRSVFELALQSSNKTITKLLEKYLFPDPFVERIAQEDSRCKSNASSSNAKRTRQERTHSGEKIKRSDKKNTVSNNT